MNCSRVVMSLLAAGTMAAAIALTDVAGSASLACVDTNAKSLVSACGCKHRKLLSDRLFGRRCCYTICQSPSVNTEPQPNQQATANAVRSDLSEFHSGLGAQPATDSTIPSETWQDGYADSATEQTGFTGRPLAEEQSESETTEEASDQMTGQQEDVNNTDAEYSGTAEAYSYESALRQTTEQFERSCQPEHFVSNGWADEPNETEEGFDDQCRPENEDINEQQMLDEQANENMLHEQTDDQSAEEQPNQQPLDEQPNDDGQPADLDDDASDDQQQAPAEDAMPDVPDSDVPDSNAQYDPYLMPETESQSNHFSAGAAADESGHSASQSQQYESQYDPYAEHQPGNSETVPEHGMTEWRQTPSDCQPGDCLQQSEAWRSELFSQTDSVAPDHPVETYETATPESQYGAWEDPQAGIPVEAASDGQCSPQTTESFSDQGTQTPESCYRYEYEYYPSDSAPRYEYTPSEPAYGRPQASDMQQNDGSAYRQPSETTESLSDDATGNDQFQAETAGQYQHQQYGMDYDEAFNAEENQSGRDQSGNDIQSDMQTESLDQDSDQRLWDAEQSYQQYEDSSSENEQSDSENQQWDNQQMQLDDQSYQHVPYQESPYDVTDDGNHSHEQSWHGSDAQYPESNPQTSKLEQPEQPYQYDYTYDDFRADDPNFKPYVPPEVTNHQAWETPADDEQSDEASGQTDQWPGAAHSSQEEYSAYSGYQWDAGYGKYGASDESAGCDMLEQADNPSDYQELEGHRRYEDSFEPNDGWRSAEEASDEPSVPAEQTIDDGQQFDWPGAEDEGRPGAEDDELSQPADRQIDAFDDSQTSGDSDASEQYDNSPRYWDDSADSQGQLPATEEDEVGDSFSERQQSEGWVPSSRQPEDAMPAAAQSGDGQDEQSSPSSTEAESNWMPLPYYRYPFTPTSTEYFLPPHVYSDSSVSFPSR